MRELVAVRVIPPATPPPPARRTPPTAPAANPPALRPGLPTQQAILDGKDLIEQVGSGPGKPLDDGSTQPVKPMISKTLGRILLGSGLLMLTHSMAIGSEAAAGKAKPMAPNHEFVDIQNSGLANIRDKDPRMVVIRAFSSYKGGIVDEGLRREVIGLTYSDSRRQANAVYTINGVASDSVGSYRYAAILVLDGELWRLTQARKQWICQQGRGHQEWSAQRCL